MGETVLVTLRAFGYGPLVATTDPRSSMAQIFPKWTNDIPRVGAPLAVVLACFATFVVWFWFSPKHTDVGYAPEQPVPYSHALHAGTFQMDCRYCHSNVERSAHAGVPPAATCMNCHQQIKADSPKLAAVRTSYQDGSAAADGGGVPWVRIHKVADYAYFNHSAHIGIKHKGVGVGCVTCHGRIDQMEVVKQVQPLSMGWCLDCHNNPAPNLRPIDQVTNMTWEPEGGWAEKAAAIAKDLHPPGNKNASEVLPDGQVIVRATAGCTGCHR
jgi:hypothetical protein